MAWNFQKMRSDLHQEQNLPAPPGQFGSWLQDDKAFFRLWAPDAERVDIVIDGVTHEMARASDGFYLAQLPAHAGSRYLFRIDGATDVPDPAAHAQAGDVHGASLVVDHQKFPWRCTGWAGRSWEETVVYELHTGACGGFSGVAAQLPRLAALGITAIELMPVADFPGAHNWGYDGVLPYAPASTYGTPNDFKALVDSAHLHGVQVFLDVVYNHFGPAGNYLNIYAKSFFRPDVHTPWGNAIDFRRRQVRDFFIENAIYWLREYRLDGLRFDAVHAIGDPGFRTELATRIRRAVPDRPIHLILENENNEADLIGGGPTRFDAQWADDWHHCLHVLLTRESEGYYNDFFEPANQLARCLAEGFCYQGDPSPHQNGKPRGTPSAHLPATAFVICLQNHDQIGNRAFGERLRSLAHPDALRAAIALLLLTPQIPMIFMGEEFGETTPFLYFTDFDETLGRLVCQGRRQEFAHFPAFADPQIRETIPHPNAPETFAASRPVFAEKNSWTTLYEDCLRLRAAEIAPRIAGCRSAGAMALSGSAVAASWRMGDGALLSVAANFDVGPAPGLRSEGVLLFGPGMNDGMLPGLTTSIWLRR